MTAPTAPPSFRLGMRAAWVAIPAVVIPAYAAIFVISPGGYPQAPPRPDWVLTAVVVLTGGVQLLAVLAAAGAYWAPRLLGLTVGDGQRQQPAGWGLLTYLAVWPPLIAALGLAWRGGAVPWWYFLLGAACWVVVIPAMLDLVRRKPAAEGGTATASPLDPPRDQLGSGPAGDRQPLHGVAMSLPDGWLTAPRSPDPDWASTCAAELSTDPEQRAMLGEILQMLQDGAESGAFLLVGAWPDAQALPDVAGTVLADSIVPPKRQRVDRERYRSLIETADESASPSLSIREMELPAGPALVIAEIAGESGEPWTAGQTPTRQKLTFVVFPPACAHAARVVFDIAVDQYDEAVQRDVSDAMRTLTVTLQD